MVECSLRYKTKLKKNRKYQTMKNGGAISLKAAITEVYYHVNER